jgi:circadian clock protein KaiC
MHNLMDASLVLKSPTGIAGFDEVTGGGLPEGRATDVAGGPCSGKTVFALQALAHGAGRLKEPGIFLAFEESAERILANAGSFGWDLPEFQRASLFFLNAQPSSDEVHSGDFEFGGMLVALDAKVEAMGARRIPFDAVDVVLSLLDGHKAVRPPPPVQSIIGNLSHTEVLLQVLNLSRSIP